MEAALAEMPAWSTPLIATACMLPVMTQVWPLKQALAVASIARGGTPPAPVRPKARSDAKVKPSWGPLTFGGIKGMHYGDLFYAACGLMIYYFSWPDPSAAKDWPALDATAVHSWVALVLARNLALEVSFYEFWHQLLFGAFANEAVTQHRYSEGSPYEPKPGQKKAQMNVWRERFWCTCGFVWSTAWECYIVQAWASGRIPACGADTNLSPAAAAGAGPLGLGCAMADPTLADFQEKPLSILWFVLAFALTTQFRGIHFFCVHRTMHPWKRPYGPKNGLKNGDIGAFLYRWVHSLHHKSHNPGPWSSLSMHPVEHLFYFSCFALAFLVPYHPCHLLLNKYHTDLSALGGHDGYGSPAADDVGHYLHHKHFECNYGFSFPNYLDRMFGTYENGDKWLSEKERSELGLPPKRGAAGSPKKTS